MIPVDNRRFARPRTTELTLASSMAAVYVASTFFPVSPFVGGGPGFITLEIVMLPVIAYLLRPALATVTVLVGSLGMSLGQPSYYQIFGLIGLLIPVVTALLGSLAFHYRLGPAVPWAFVVVGALFYIGFSQGGTLFWLLPYALVVFSLPLALSLRGKYRIILLCFYAAMSEQVALNVLSIQVLGLVGPIWAIITPFMYGERAFATVVGALVVVGLKSGLGRMFELEDPVPLEVKL